MNSCNATGRRRGATNRGAVAATLLAAALLLNLSLARAQNVSETVTAGVYTITLKILPAEAFTGPNATMERESGAQANAMAVPGHQIHHMVVFVTRGGKPVEHATVEIRYRRVGPRMSAWNNLPVVRMNEVGKGPETTHYGNNLTMVSGSYDVSVSVNNAPEANFRVRVSGG